MRLLAWAAMFGGDPTRRAVLSGYGFAAAAKGQIEAKRLDWSGRSEELAEMVDHLQWDRLKTVWIKWLLQGLRQ